MPVEVIGRYQIQGMVGAGGMAAVYRAWDPLLARQVALKWMSEELSHRPGFVARFEQEARIVARLENTHIVPIYDLGKHEGRPYLVMRLLEGGTLMDQIAGGKMRAEDAAHLVAEVGQALSVAHRHDIIHRDVKPLNILFDEHDRAVLTDFGLAKVISDTVRNSVDLVIGKSLHVNLRQDEADKIDGRSDQYSHFEITEVDPADALRTPMGRIMGTPMYMSPEQYQADKIDSRSDQYSLAVVLFQVLSGQLPFKGDWQQLLFQHLSTPPPDVRELNEALPAAISPVLQKAMAKNPDHRYPDILAFTQAVQEALSVAIQESGPRLDDILPKLQGLLCHTDQFVSDAALQVLFIHPPLRPWRNHIPQAMSVQERVASTIAYLLDKYNVKGQNALVLLLNFMTLYIHEEDRRHAMLKDMAAELESALRAASR